MKIIFRISVTTIAIIALLFVYSKQSSAVSDSIEPFGNVAVVTEAGESGTSNINFSWKDAEGRIASFDEFRGKVVLVNFWATWCVPCRKEIPYLIEIDKELDDDVYATIGISVDQASIIERVDMFLKDQNVTYINILDDGRLTRQFGNIRVMPTTFIIDKEGNVRETIVGIRTKEQFLEKINRYL